MLKQQRTTEKWLMKVDKDRVRQTVPYSPHWSRFYYNTGWSQNKGVWILNKNDIEHLLKNRPTRQRRDQTLEELGFDIVENIQAGCDVELSNNPRNISIFASSRRLQRQNFVRFGTYLIGLQCSRCIHRWKNRESLFRKCLKVLIRSWILLKLIPVHLLFRL